MSAATPISVLTGRGATTSKSTQQDAAAAALSLSPRSNPSDIDGDNHDEVFSNPDTAELDGRSDGTGATSPGPSSPGQRPHVLGSQSQSPMQSSGLSQGHGRPGAKSPTPDGLTSSHKPRSPQEASIASTTTAKATSRAPKPSFAAGSFPNASQMPGRSAPVSPAAGILPPHVPNYFPSAHGLPSDPREAATLSTLFAVAPAQSPSEEISAMNLGGASGAAGVGTPGSVVGDRRLSSVIPSMGISALLRSRPTTRPSSPDRVGPRSGISPSISHNLAGLTASRPATSAAAEAAAAPDIFERDIEHRDAAHIMSSQEAVDVAIPSVLDDAVEAITEGEAEDLEIVAPHAAPTALALSAQALSAHAHSQTGSPAPRSLASLPSASEAPPGSIAAQLAERFGAGSPTRVLSDDGSQGIPSPGGASKSGHRRLLSDATSALSSSSGSLPPRSAGGPSVQQLLEQSATASSSAAGATATSPTRTRVSTSPPPPVAGLRSSRSQTNLHALAQASNASAAPSKGGMASSITMSSQLPHAAAFPSLPLPNPFRSASPAITNITLPAASGAAPDPSPLSTVSMDGAIIPSSDVATLDGSLDVLVDAVARSEADEAASPYVGRSPMHFSPVPGSPVLERSRLRGRQQHSEAHGGHPTSITMPGAAGGLGMLDAGIDADGTIRQKALGPRTPSTTASDRRRLSFFSYADIINQTPGEVLDFGAAVERAAEVDEEKHASVGLGVAGMAGAMSPVASSSATASVAMGRSLSSSAAQSPRTGMSPSASMSMSGATTPAYQSRVLSHRLDGLQLATSPERAAAASAPSPKE